MKKLSIARQKTLLSLMVVSLTLLAGTSQAALDDVVMVRGKTTETNSIFVQSGNSARGASPQQICEATYDFLLENNLISVDNAANPNEYVGIGHGILSRFYQSLVVLPPTNQPGVVERATRIEADRTIVRLRDCGEARMPTDYAMVITTCSMLIHDGSSMMWWTIPPGAPQAQMLMLDAASREVIFNANLDAVLGDLSKVGNVNKVSESVSPSGGSKEFELIIERGVPGRAVETLETFNAREYEFKYEGAIAPMEDAGIALTLGKVNTFGTAYLAADVPGSDVMSAFYSNFRTHISPNPSIFTHTIDQWASMVSVGVPLEVEQTIRVRVMAIGPATTSSNSVGSISVYESGASREQMCGRISIPDGFDVLDYDEMMAGATGGQGADTEVMNDAMSAMQEAMKGLTPEQRAAMEAMGIPIPGMPASEPPATAATSSSGSSMSESLTTDNMTESVQKHLEYLGYETDNTDGKGSLYTSIAISQFQAEHGMDVTGEASPQLLGKLSAEVDKK